MAIDQDVASELTNNLASVVDASKDCVGCAGVINSAHLTVLKDESVAVVVLVQVSADDYAAGVDTTWVDVVRERRIDSCINTLGQREAVDEASRSLEVDSDDFPGIINADGCGVLRARIVDVGVVLAFFQEGVPGAVSA